MFKQLNNLKTNLKKLNSSPTTIRELQDPKAAFVRADPSGRERLTQMQAAAKYDISQPTLKEAYPRHCFNVHISTTGRIFKKNSTYIEPSIFTTSTGIILLRKPLEEAIQTDGKAGGNADKFIVDESDGVTSRVAVTDAFLQALSSAKMKMGDTGLIVFERFEITDKGNSSYDISIENLNGSLRAGFLNSIPALLPACEEDLPGSDLITETGAHPFLFGTNRESFPVYLSFSGKDVKIGFASGGYGGVLDFENNRDIPCVGIGYPSDYKFQPLVKKFGF